MDRQLKQIDLLRHELKALRFILDNFHAGAIAAGRVPPRADFQSEQARIIYDHILQAPSRAAAEAQLAALDIEDFDTASFLRLSGELYYAYPELIRARAAAIRSGQFKVETS